MDNKIEERFPWLPIIQRGFFESFSGDYRIGLLEQLQRNINEEIQNIECNRDLKTAKHLLKGVEYFYYHFCRIWNYQNTVYPYFFEFSSSMKSTWVHLLSSFIKICLLLSKEKESKWISEALNAIARFPGDKNLIYDALLFIHSLKSKYKPAYGAILKSLLMDMPLFVSVVIDDPVVFLKLYLLIRRFKLIIKDRSKKAELQMKVSKIMAPSSLWDWLLDHDFIVPWTKKGAKKVNLGVNICRKLGCNESQLEIVETLRKILLPGMCTERNEQRKTGAKNFAFKREYVSVSCAEDSSEDDKENVSNKVESKTRAKINSVSVTFTVPVSSKCKKITADERKNNSEKRKTCFSVPFADQESEDDKEEIAVNETKSKKLKRVRKKSQEKSEEGMSVGRLEMRNLNETLEDDIVDYEENVSLTMDHSSTINIFDDELVSEKKNKKKQKLHLEENLLCKIGCVDLPFQEHSSKSFKLATEKTKKRRKPKLDKIAEKILSKANKIIDTQSCLLQDNMADKEQSVGERNWVEIESTNKQQKNGVGNCDSEGEPKSRKRQRKKFVAKENTDDRNKSFCDHSLLEGVSQAAKITNNRRKQQNRQKAKQLDNKSKETDFIDINGESDAEDLPVIVDEIFVDESIPDKRVCLSKSIVNSNSSCTDDQPVILKEVKHCLDSDLTSSHRKKKKDTKIELKSKFWEKKKLIAENIFIIDSKPSLCFNKSGTKQISYNEMYDAEQKDTSCQKSEYISNSEESLNSSETLACLQDEDLPEEADSRLKITDYSHDPKDIQGSCASSSSHFRSDQQEPFPVKKIRTLSGNQTSLNKSHQDCKSEDGDNAFSSFIKEQSNYAPQTVEFSQDSAVQTEGLNYPPNQNSDLAENCIKSNQTSKKLMDIKENIPKWTDFEMETTQKTNISQEFLPILESHGSPVLGTFLVNNDSSVQEIETRKNEYPSIETCELISVINNVDFTETNPIASKTTENNVKKYKIIQENRVFESLVDFPLDNTYSLKTDKISSLSVSNECVDFNSLEKANIEDNCSIKIKSGAPLENSASSLENKMPLQLIPINNSFQGITINEEKLNVNCSLPDKIKSEVVSDSDSYSSFEVDDLEVKNGIDNTYNDIQRQSQNNSIDLSKYHITGLFFDVKSLNSKPEDGLLKNTEISPRISDLKAQNLDGEIKSSMVETPNTSAAKVTIESVLKLAEFVDCGRESKRRNINKGDLISALNGPSVKHLSKSISSAANKKPTECLSFLDISAENAGSLKERQSFVCHTPEISEFLQYRDVTSDQVDNRSEDTLSESKSISKTDSSEYPSDASNYTESEGSKSSPRGCNSPVSSPDIVPESSSFKNNYDTYVVKTEYSWSDAITRQRFCQGDEYETCSLQNNQMGISKKNVQLKGCMLNPVVNLGEKCDKSFINMNSSKSLDSLSIPTNLSVLPDIKHEDKEINETRPLKSNQASLTVDQLLIPVNETSGKQEKTGTLTSNTEKHDVKVLYLMANQELTPFSEDQESFKLAGDRKDLSQDQKATKYDKDPKLPICDKDQVSVELTRKKVSPDNKITRYVKEESKETRKEMELSLGRKLRKKTIEAIQTEKSMSGDEGSIVLYQETAATHCMNLRNKNLMSSGEGKSASANEDSNVLNQEGPATQCMILRSKHPSLSSIQGKSVSASEDSNILYQETAATHCMNPRNKNPTSSGKGKSASANEDSSVLNQDGPATQCMILRNKHPSLSSTQGKSVSASENSNVLYQETAATHCINLRSRNSSTSSIQEAMRHRSQTLTKRSSKRLKKDVNLNLGFDFSELSLNSPKALRSKPNGSSIKNSSEVVWDKSPTHDRENSCRRSTRVSVISSTVDTRIKEEDTDPEGYNLRSRKSVIMPGKLKF